MYKVIYSVTTDSCGRTFALLGLLPVAVGVILLSLRRRWSLLRRRGLWYPVSMIVGGCIWSIAAGLFVLRCHGLRMDLAAARTDVIDGVIERYAENSREAVFYVGGHSFAVAPYRIGPGYKLLRRGGSPLKDGLRVRLHYKGDDILMIEIQQ
ncbi:MAG TPA: hypothetical protein VI356_19300 [Myxococcales bacterium]